MASRQNIPLDGGATLVLLRDEGGSRLRLLAPVDGVPTYVPPAVALERDDLVGLAERLPYVAELGGLRVEVLEGPEGDRFRGPLIVTLGEQRAEGQRIDLHQVLRRW